MVIRASTSLIRRSISKRLIFATILALALTVAGCSSESGSDTSASSQPSEATQNTTIAETAGDFAGLVDIGGGRQMYLECRGTGSPTVVLISGFRGAHDDWTNVVDPAGNPKRSDSAVFPEIASFTRV